MPQLSSLVRTVFPGDYDRQIEDVFAGAKDLIFPDDSHTSHGDPAATIIYMSRRFGDIELKTTDPGDLASRRLFSHYLWNSAIKLAELISDGDLHDDWKWSVKREIVLELGAGLGLDSIIATLAGAQEVVASDYPTTIVLDNIQRNIAAALPDHLSSVCKIEGHGWGELDTSFALRNKHRFTRILAADCYWMESHHANLVGSMLHFLTFDPHARVFVVAAFHTGRGKVVSFLEEAARQGFVVDGIYEEDADGVRREWSDKERKGDRGFSTERHKWLAIAQLKRA